jgi:hypothetical protein
MINKTYRLADGGVITASTAIDFVRKLHKSSFFDSRGTEHEYMISFCDRYKQLCGKVVDISTPESFLADLLEQHYVEIIE